MKEIKKVGIVAMPIISSGGGFQKVARDLIANLNALGKKVHLLSPFKIDLKKIEELYGKIEIEKFYYPENKIVTIFGREETIGRKLMTKQFQEMAKEVDFIIDLDGRVFHKYLPENFDRNNYVIWRLSCINPETHKLQKFTNWKMISKKILKKFMENKKDIPKEIKIYPLDEWTKKEIIDFWKVKPQDMCMYPEIQVEELNPKTKKENQIVILSRIAPNKDIQSSIKIFANGTKKFPKYNLVIIGGSTPDTEKYLEELNKLIKELKIQDRVKIIRDASFGMIKETLEKSKIIIDSQIGISLSMPIIEAMAAGCIPIMKKYNGTFTEILGKGEYGYGFENIEEGTKILDELLSRKKWENKKSIERAQFLSSEKFKLRLEKMFYPKK